MDQKAGGAGAGMQKKQKLQLAMEEAELRTLKIPAAAHRGTLSPSKNSFLPTLQEQQQERIQVRGRTGRGARAPGAGRGRAREEGDASESPERDANTREKQHQQQPAEFNVLQSLDAPRLASLKRDFLRQGGQLEEDQFVTAMMRHIGEQAPEEPALAGVSFGDDDAPRKKKKADQEREAVFQTAAVLDLFRQIDVSGEGALTWEEVSNYLIERLGSTGGSGRDDFTVDNIKTYEASAVLDTTKHEDAVEKLVYLEQIDAMVSMSHNSRKFRLYDPKKCTLRHEVAGHRGTVINCCYVDSLQQVATTAADMTICLWDCNHLGLRNRMSTKDVQLCLQWCDTAESLFSGSIDGTLNRWDLQSMCLGDARKGHHKRAINDLLMIKDINLLASASSDASILMWDCAAMRPKKTLRGHKKGVFSLAYSTDYHCVLSAGLDQDALVWNPYVERTPIFRLKGHTHALCGVTVVPQTPQILTADVAGTFRLWDMRNFRCVQTFGGTESLHDLNTFVAIPQHKRLAAGSARITLYDYMDEWGGENVTDPAGVTAALYNDTFGAFYTVSKRTMKAWSAHSGQLFKVLRDVSKYEITAVSLSANERKIYVGDARGRVCSHNLWNGTMLKAFEPHAADVSCLAVWEGTNRVISAAWDGTVKVHGDERTQRPTVKAEFAQHRDGVTCLSVCPELLLLASGGTDCQVVLYDLRTLKAEHALTQFRNVVAGLDFLPSRALLACADQGGIVSLWFVRPHPRKWQCVFAFDNIDHFNRVYVPQPEEEKMLENSGGGEAIQHWEPGVLSPIALHALKFGPEAPPPTVTEGGGTALAGSASTTGVVALPGTHEDPGFPRNCLYTADAKGNIRCWSLERLWTARRIEKMDFSSIFKQQLRMGQGPATGKDGAGAAGSAPGLGLRDAMKLQVAPSGGSGSPSPVADGSAAATAAGVQASVGGPTQAGSSGVADGDSGGGAFLTSLEEAGPDISEGAAAEGEGAEVRVLFEISESSDAVVSLRFLQGPGALLTCGLDKKVRTFSRLLSSFGVLLQSRDRGWRFPYDPSQVRATQLQEAQTLRARLLEGEEKPAEKDPPRGGAVAAGKPAQRELKELQEETDLSLQPGLLDETMGRGRTGGYAKKKSSDPVWKFTAGQLTKEAADGSIPTREDFQILYDQMSRDGAADMRPDRVENRLLRKAHLKHSQRMNQRAHALSIDEAAAAERLARAMGAMGGDDFGVYARMAETLNPTGRQLTKDPSESMTPDYGFANYDDPADDDGTPESY